MKIRELTFGEGKKNKNKRKIETCLVAEREGEETSNGFFEFCTNNINVADVFVFVR